MIYGTKFWFYSRTRFQNKIWVLLLEPGLKLTKHIPSQNKNRYLETGPDPSLICSNPKSFPLQPYIGMQNSFPTCSPNKERVQTWNFRTLYSMNYTTWCPFTVDLGKVSILNSRQACKSKIIRTFQSKTFLRTLKLGRNSTWPTPKFWKKKKKKAHMIGIHGWGNGSFCPKSWLMIMRDARFWLMDDEK